MIKFLSALILLLVTTAAQAERIRDLTSVQGVRQNSLIGYGLVVGLDGTGDQTTQTPFTTQTLNNMLSQLGITVPTGTNMQLKNVAAVMVTDRKAHGTPVIWYFKVTVFKRKKEASSTKRSEPK